MLRRTDGQTQSAEHKVDDTLAIACLIVAGLIIVMATAGKPFLQKQLRGWSI